MRSLILGLCTCLPLLGTTAPAQKVLDFVPNDVPLVVVVPEIGSTIDNVRDAVETFCAHPMLNAGLQQVLEEAAQELGFNFLQKNTWRTLGVNIRGDAAFFMDFLQKESGDIEPWFAIVLPVSDAPALKGWIGSIVSRKGQRKMEWREAAPGVMQPYVESWDGEAMSAAEVALATKGDYLIIGGSDDEASCVKACSIALNCSNSLAREQLWAAGVQAVGAGADMYMGMRLDKFMSSIHDAMMAEAARWAKEAAEAGEEESWKQSIAESTRQQAAQFEWIRDLMGDVGQNMMMAMSASDRGVRLSMGMQGKNLAKYYTPQTPAKGLNYLVPSDPLALLRYTINPDAFGEIFDQIPEEMKGEMDLDEIDDAIEMGNAMLGVDLVEDVFKQLSGRFQLALGNPGEEFHKILLDAVESQDMDEGVAMQLLSMADFHLAIEFKDASGMFEMVETLMAMATEAAPFAIETKTLDKGKVWYLGPEQGGEMIPLGGVAIVNDIVVLGTTKAIQGALARAASNTLPQLAHPEVQKSLLSDTSTALYIDFKPIHRFVKALGKNMQEEEIMIVEAILTSLDTLTMVSDSRGDAAVATMELRFK